jgi:putative aldouronate transport system permease protein
MTLQLYLFQTLQKASILSQMTQRAGVRLGDAASRISPQTVRYATMVVATLPIILVYPWLQKYFVKGVMIGSIKG